LGAMFLFSRYIYAASNHYLESIDVWSTAALLVEDLFSPVIVVASGRDSPSICTFHKPFVFPSMVVPSSISSANLSHRIRQLPSTILILPLKRRSYGLKGGSFHGRQCPSSHLLWTFALRLASRQSV